MSADFLKTIAHEKLKALDAKRAYYENLKANLTGVKHHRYQIFKQAISQPGQINLIAEVKKASPSAGLIREDFNAVGIAKIYQDHHAAAISVLTEDKYFLGSFSYLHRIGDALDIPTLMKDFIVHEYQIYEGAFHGASAVLLIVAMLTDKQLIEFQSIAHDLGMDCLVEVHDRQELTRALEAGAEIIGVNNRNLHTMEVDINNCLNMIPHIPKGHIIVAESGLKTHDDIITVKKAGAHAVLIGETFMKAYDIGAKVKEVMHGTN